MSLVGFANEFLHDTFIPMGVTQYGSPKIQQDRRVQGQAKLSQCNLPNSFPLVVETTTGQCVVIN